MSTPPRPDDGFGVIGDVRSFTQGDVEWRVFEYRSPGAPHLKTLIVLNSRDHHSFERYPENWRTMPATELLKRLSIQA